MVGKPPTRPSRWRKDRQIRGKGSVRAGPSESGPKITDATEEVAHWRGGTGPGGHRRAVRGIWTTDGVAARTQQARVVPVETATAERKTMPVQLRALGTVTPIASVAIKTQVDTTITSVRFRDGARVEKGDELFTLDCRQIEAD